MIRTRHIQSGGWRTARVLLERPGTAFFRGPAGASVKVRCGVGSPGFDRQRQRLDGAGYKKLEVGLGSVSFARMQVRLSQSTDVTCAVYGGGVAVSTPDLPFGGGRAPGPLLLR